ncbi:Beta-L-arabinofuranosidase [Proteiniphilum saccharofermentans]|uniref:Beta-L-arabinofuranosidase n=2 Tax=Proteiniphilum saccharofermentans TaxID=1642647 RepID=A0A1R3SU57_9BACT|nr:Beta-L-arabinofuranosidase [Proteiniphilum saccharofermentans]
MDTLISYIAGAQLPDGYLYTAWNLRAKDYSDAYCLYEKDRYDNLKDSHELYNAGHMYEAAVAHYQATGQTNFLDIATKNADHIYDLFGPGKREAVPGHQEIEIGLVKLYRVTRNPKYLEMAKLFLDRRGKGLGAGAPYSQDHKPVTEQEEAVGHAVRANYMYTAMTDIAALTGDQEYVRAIDKLWENVVNKKMYLTGGMGALYHGEAYGKNYELPNISYAETCASIAGVYWNHRMFLLHGDAKYIDVMERIMYNGLISGVSLDGTKFFYPNVLYADGKLDFNQGKPGRSEWFTCSCCPTNIVRFVSSVPGYLYATCGDQIYVNLYMDNTVNIELKKTDIRIEQQTDYPWNGTVRTIISPSRKTRFTVNFRIPGWTQGSPVPGDLYTYTNNTPAKPVITINGVQADVAVEKGYAKIDREWKKGDIVELEFLMEVKKVVANENVEADNGRIALEYGPLVYCLEEPDNGPVDHILLDKNANFKAHFQSDILGGVTVLEGDATIITLNENKVSGMSRPVKAIPYYAWNHRGDKSMVVWIPYRMQGVSIHP